MADNEINSLESIIKVEPEELQQTSMNEVLRSNANIFTDPILLFERLEVLETSPLLRLQSELGNSVEALTRKGNEGLLSKHPHTCCICRKVFSCRGYARKHIGRIHLRRLKCDLCPKVYSGMSDIRKHILEVHGKRSFACNVCGYETHVKKILKNHKLIHGDKVKCPVCNKHVSSLREHMRTHNNPKEKCDICQKLVSKRIKKQHMKMHSIRKCGSCEEVFRNKDDLRRHYFEKHHDGEVHHCYCGLVFKSMELLKKHKQTHNKTKACRVCPRIFANVSNLRTHWRRKHIETHGALEYTTLKVLSRNGPFICDKCGSIYSTRDSFHMHNSTRHRNASIFCDLCPQSFTQKYLILAHMEKDHLKLRFDCKTCESNFSCQRDLTKHMWMHNFKTKCNVCHKLVSNMRAHSKLHVR